MRLMMAITCALELQLFGRDSALCSGETRIIAGDGEGCLLVMKLRGTTDCGARMPLTGILADETVDCIAAWIDQLDPAGSCETCSGTACSRSSARAMLPWAATMASEDPVDQEALRAEAPAWI